MRGHAVDPEDAERQRHRQVGFGDAANDGVDRDGGMGLPAEPAGKHFADAEIRVAALDDVADGQRAHHGTDFNRGCIAGGIGDPAAHRRLDRQETVADQNLAVRETGEGSLDDGEILRLRHALRTRDENGLAVVHAVISIIFTGSRPLERCADAGQVGSQDFGADTERAVAMQPDGVGRPPHAGGRECNANRTTM